MMSHYYLRSDTVAEPMVNRWYAWPMLISPATAAFITLKTHLKILQSYIRMPKMHEAAAQNARMRGGPFIDFTGEETVAHVQSYLDSIQNNCAHILEFATALSEFNTLLQQSADGHSLIPLYSQIPEILRGYIELVYDANNNPGYRLLESLLYQSPFYNTSGQEIMLSTLRGDYRSFVLSTPRLCFNNQLVWKIAFDNPAIDQFFALREYGLPHAEIEAFYKQHFPDNEHARKIFWSLLTEKKPQTKDTYKRYQGEGIRIRYFGHACVLIETKHTTILTDCLISYGYQTEVYRYTFDDLPERIDYVVLTHSHQDHVLLEHLLQLRYKIMNLVVPKNIPGAIQDPSLKLMFKTLKFKNVIELDELESVILPEGEIMGIPFFGEHGDLNVTSKMAYIIKLQNKSLLFAADSNNLEPMLYSHIQKIVPKLDVIFLGMECDGAPLSWLYGPILGKTLSRPMDQSRRLDGSDSDKAMDIIRRFNCPEVYVYAMGQEPWLGYITSIEYTNKSRPLTESDRLIQLCQNENRIAERLYAFKEINLNNE
jgi:L-ascorbate metabolism protein UlaG (beta-lactamase superfamily)